MKMKVFDAGCFCGNWPFHRVRRNTFADITQLHFENEVTGGCISALDAVWYNDPTEADDLLAQTIAGSGYKQVLCVNPMLPSWRQDIERRMATGLAGVRLYPGYHGYLLTDPEVLALCEAAKAQGLAVFVSLRMEDERNTYIFQPRPIPAEEIAEFAAKTSAMSATVILSQIRLSECVTLKETIAKPHMYIDTAGFKDGMFCIEKVLAAVSADKVLFASYAPMNALRSTLFTITMDNITDEQKEKILFKNACQVFGL